MTLEAAKSLALTILRQVMEEKLTPVNIECGVITMDKKQFRLLTEKELEDLVKALPPPENIETK